MSVRKQVWWIVLWLIGWGAELPARGQAAPAPEALALPGIDNAYRLAPGLYSGAQPEGDAAFAALQRLGVRTILTVDGAEPDVELARKYGMRYVHLPIGYDGMTRAQAVRIAEAARRLPGPVFVHCHHGQHRGPAAAGVCAIAMEGWSPAEATAWLRAAGTDPRYPGLYAAVRDFRPPTAAERDQVDAAFPERAAVPALVELMIGIDHQADGLKAAQKGNLESAVGAAALVREGYREALRLSEGEARGPAFVAAMTAAEANAEALRRALDRLRGAPTADNRASAEGALGRALADCKGCHATHRDAASFRR